MNFAALENNLVRLQPLTRDDFDSLFQAAADKEIWVQHPSSDRYTLEGFTEYFSYLLKSDIAYLILEKKNNTIIGATCYYQYKEDAKSIAIGYTFLVKSCWGGPYNRSVKLLMLKHAFQYVDEVLFHVHSENQRSQSALKKIGATKRTEYSEAENPKSLKYEYVIHIKDFVSI